MSAKSKAEKHADTLAGMIDGKDDDLSKTLEPIRKFLLSLDETKKTKSASDPKLVAVVAALREMSNVLNLALPKFELNDESSDDEDSYDDVVSVLARAEDAIAKRIIIRTAAAGERVTVHSRDGHRWDSVRMPNIVVTEDPRPAPGTTVSVVDGTVAPAPRPSTVISVYPPNTPADSASAAVIAQTHPHLIRVTSAGRSDEVEVEFFRAENRYAADSVGLPADLVAVE